MNIMTLALNRRVETSMQNRPGDGADRKTRQVTHETGRDTTADRKQSKHMEVRGKANRGTQIS